MLEKVLRIWPGVHGLFRYGRWSFLTVALSFAVCLDVFLVANCFWTELISPATRNYAICGLLGVWFLLHYLSGILERRIETVRNTDRKTNRFSDAIIHYLQGNWFETECVLNVILKQNPRDAEALLMLATLYRHTGRFQEGLHTLAKMRKIEESQKWFIEIELEREYLEHALSIRNAPPSEPQPTPEPPQESVPETDSPVSPTPPTPITESKTNLLVAM